MPKGKEWSSRAGSQVVRAPQSNQVKIVTDVLIEVKVDG
jgi:hypothetical protein